MRSKRAIFWDLLTFMIWFPALHRITALTKYIQIGWNEERYFIPQIPLHLIRDDFPVAVDAQGLVGHGEALDRRVRRYCMKEKSYWQNLEAPIPLDFLSLFYFAVRAFDRQSGSIILICCGILILKVKLMFIINVIISSVHMFLRSMHMITELRSEAKCSHF